MSREAQPLESWLIEICTWLSTEATGTQSVPFIHDLIVWSAHFFLLFIRDLLVHTSYPGQRECHAHFLFKLCDLTRWPSAHTAMTAYNNPVSIWISVKWKCHAEIAKGLLLTFPTVHACTTSPCFDFSIFNPGLPIMAKLCNSKTILQKTHSLNQIKTGNKQHCGSYLHTYK